MLSNGMVRVRKSIGHRIAENRGGLFKTNLVFLEIGGCLGWVGFKFHGALFHEKPRVLPTPGTCAFDDRG